MCRVSMCMQSSVRLELQSVSHVMDGFTCTKILIPKSTEIGSMILNRIKNEESAITTIRDANIDNILDAQEKTSLVFLLCDDARQAHCMLTKKLRDTHQPEIILSDLFSMDNNDERTFICKLIEALILIKNYKLVHMLGFSQFDIDNLKKWFLLTNYQYYINIVRKKLLRMCEEMSNDELRHLVNLVEQDLLHLSTNESNLLQPKPMEINLLCWIMKGIISDGSMNKKLDVSHLLKQLNIMKKFDIAKELQSCHLDFYDDDDDVGFLYKDTDLFENQAFSKSMSRSIAVSNDDIYSVDKENMGLCIIVNQTNFSSNSNSNPLQQRHGTNNDRDMLRITFTSLGYNIHVLEDQTCMMLRKNLERIIQNQVLPCHSSLVVCILSHGKRDIIYCVDGTEVFVEEIESMVFGNNCPQLLGKPKILIIAACQGSIFQKALPNPIAKSQEFGMLQCDGPSTNVAVSKMVPPTADVLTYWATVPGYSAIRHLCTGTFFVQTLCAHLLKTGHSKHLVDITTNVNSELSKKHFGEECIVTMPQVKHTFTKNLYFPVLLCNKKKTVEMLYYKYVVDIFISSELYNLASRSYFTEKKKLHNPS